MRSFISPTTFVDIAFVKDVDKNNFPYLQATCFYLFGRTTNPQQEKGPHKFLPRKRKGQDFADHII